MFNIKKILYFILPFVELKVAEKNIRNNIEKIIDNKELPLTSDEIKKVKIEEIEKYYNDTFLTKKTLEDKAKLGIIGVTITIGLVYSITSNYGKLSTVTLMLSIIALLYSLTAGYLALSILSDKNQVYKLSIKDLLLKERRKKDALLITYILNTKQNIIRQNYVYSSYRHLVYALIIIIIAFLSNPFFYKQHKDQSTIIKCKIINSDISKTVKLLKSKIDSNEKSIKLLSAKMYHDNNKSNKQIKVKDFNLSKNIKNKDRTQQNLAPNR